MTNWRTDIEDGVRDFLAVATLGRDPILMREIDIAFLPAPHDIPQRLPEGMMAVYGFWHDGTWLKIGKAGPNSNARYTSQHYYAGSAPSTLAGSLMADPLMAMVVGSDRLFVARWIKLSTSRVNILLPATRPLELLSRLEAVLHARLRPRYEGHSSIRDTI